MSGRRAGAFAPGHGSRARLTTFLASVAVVASLPTGCGLGSRSEPAADAPIVSTFTVPTYTRDKGSGMDALVSGRLWFTVDGCTLLSSGDGADLVTRAVYFPDATGVTYDNGVRAVVGADGGVFAVEGQEFAYGGGFVVNPESDLGKQWLDQCPGTEVREGAVINDEPASPPSTVAPPLPARPGPTAPTTAGELGYFPVPSYEWKPDAGGPDFVTGTVTMADGRCPVMTTSAGDHERAVGLVLPDAEGFQHPQQAPRAVIYSTSPSGTSGLMVEDGQLTGFHGRTASSDDSAWAAVCARVPVDSVFYVQDFPIQ